MTPTKNAKQKRKDGWSEDERARFYVWMVQTHYEVAGYEDAFGFLASHIGRMKFKIEQLEKEIRRLKSK